MMQWKLGACMWGMPKKGVEGIRHAAELGFSGAAIDVSWLDAPDEAERKARVRAYRDAAEASGIRYAALSVELLNEIGLTRSMRTLEGQRAFDACRRGIALAEALGADILQFPSFNDGAIRSRDDLQATCEQLNRICEEAACAGVSIASENDLDEAWSQEMLRALPWEHFGILFDTQNYFLNGVEDSAALFLAIAPRVVQIHVKDGVDGIVSNALIGEGVSGFEKTASAIKEAYRGEWILIETYYDRPPFSGMQAEPLIQKDLQTVRAAFAN